MGANGNSSEYSTRAVQGRNASCACVVALANVAPAITIAAAVTDFMVIPVGLFGGGVS